MSIEAAATIHWGDFLPYHDYQELCPITDTPESWLIMKETVQNLSEEGKFLLNFIKDLPDELFLVNGKPKKTEICKILRKNYRWSLKLISITWQEITNLM
jgi:hypothetical protein